jgi:hypothetical protein
MISRLIGLTILGAVLISAQAQAGDIYRWIDERGGVNYGDSVPDQYKRVARKVNIIDDVVGTQGAASGAREKAQAKSPTAPSSATGSGRPAEAKPGAAGN